MSFYVFEYYLVSINDHDLDDSIDNFNISDGIILHDGIQLNDIRILY